MLGGARHWFLYHLRTITASRHLLYFIIKSVDNMDCYSTLIASWGSLVFLQVVLDQGLAFQT